MKNEIFLRCKRLPLKFMAVITWVLLIPGILFTLLIANSFRYPDMLPLRLLTFPMLALCIALAWWLAKGQHKSWLKHVTSSKAPSWASERTYGNAGDLASAKGVFSDQNIASGSEGERRTAEILKELEERPAVRIFHGLQWLGTQNADVDHAILYGYKLALIDSKLWAGIKHHLNSDGTVLSIKADGTTVDREIKFHRAADAFTDALPWLEVRSYIAVHSPSMASETTRASTIPVNGFGSLEEVLWLIESWFDLNRTDVVDLDTLENLRRITKSPLAA